MKETVNIEVKHNNFDLFDRLYVFTLFFAANILSSPLLYHISFGMVKLWMPIILILFSVLLILVFIKGLSNIHIKNYILYIYLLFELCQFVYGVYYQSIKAINYNGGLILGIFLALFLKDMNIHNKYINIFIKWSTVFMIILIAGAYIGFIYYFRGGRAILSIYNPDGRLNGLYLTTFSNSNYIMFIRPGGIYDEPGAFSFFICGISLLRVLFKRNDSITFFLLFSGLITFSLTHFLVLLSYMTYFILKYRCKRITFLIVSILILCMIGMYILFREAFDTLLFTRLDSTDKIINNNRTAQIPNIIKGLNLKSFFFGRIADHNFNFSEMTKYTGGDISSNPLTPLISSGLIGSLIYYLFLCLVFFAALLKKKLFFIFIAIFILFLQRPFFTARGYCIYFILFFIVTINYISSNVSPLVFRNRHQ